MEEKLDRILESQRLILDIVTPLGERVARVEEKVSGHAKILGVIGTMITGVVMYIINKLIGR